MVRFALIACLILGLSGCPSQAPPEELRFDEALVFGLLDKDVDVASAALLEKFPGSTRLDGGYHRYHVAGSEVLDEIILFRNVRSQRVDAVILKYRADLTPVDRQRVFAEAGSPELVDVHEVRHLEWQRGLHLRFTPADRFGRLTLTVEP